MAKGIDESGAHPAYVRIAARLRAGYDAGAKLPSTAELADQFDVAAVTVRKAVQLLRDEGLITSTQGLGIFYVTERPEPTPTDDGDTPAGLAAELAALAKRVAALARDERGK